MVDILLTLQRCNFATFKNKCSLEIVPDRQSESQRPFDYGILFFMAAKDRLHNNAKKALEQDGWTITHDPLSISTEDGIDVAIDLAAERILAAEREDEKIAVEIKSFMSLSVYYEFHTALGQFLNYREVLEEHEPERTLFLAIPDEIYQTLFQRKTVGRVLERYQVNLIVFDPKQEVVILWKK